jgi:uncharacterized protein (DUF58 family)
MLPIPTPRAIAAFVGCAAILALGLALVHPTVTVLATSGFAALALALAATMPLGRRVRRQRLEFAWWLAHGDPSAGGGAVVPGAPFEVRCYVRHRGDAALLLAAMTPLVPGGAKILEGDPDLLPLSPRGRTEFSFRLVAPAAGRVVLHGLAVTLRGPLGLFEVPLYFPNPLAIKVLPRAAAHSRGASRTATALPVERASRSLVRRRGGGTDLHELRDLVPGDPFKSIAWKASARTGRLLVREVEREVQELRYVVLDVSGTMRGGEAGRRKLDWAIEAAAAEARRAVDAGDRLALITVDGRILSHVVAGEGQKQMIRVYDALLGATEVVDQDLTDVDDDELVSIVARYVRNQDGLDFAAKDRPGGWEVGALVKHVGRALAQEPERERVIAGSPASSLLRRFCRARGIPLPYRPDPRDGMKGPGLAAALREAGGRTREPCSIICVTDLDGIGESDSLVSAFKLLRARGHAIALVVPDARTFAPLPKTAIERDLFLVYGRSEERRIREARSLFGRLGVSVTAARHQDAPALVIARATGGARGTSPIRAA